MSFIPCRIMCASTNGLFSDERSFDQIFWSRTIYYVRQWAIHGTLYTGQVKEINIWGNIIMAL